MEMSPKIPQLLERYVELPPEAWLILLTNTLGATSNWLVLRYLYSFLARKAGVSNDITEDKTSVVLVSFLRSYAFWKEGASRLALNLDSVARDGRFVFVDGLGSHLPTTAQLPSTQPQVTNLGSRSLRELEEQITTAIGHVRGDGTNKPVLIIDNPDLLLATAADHATGPGLLNLISRLRQNVHACILTMAADAPLMSNQATTLEKEHASTVLSLAHASDLILGMRMLDTGVASDVSGVVRIARGGVASHDIVDREYLYYIGVDGGCRVLERGR